MICAICSRHGHGAYACPWRRITVAAALCLLIVFVPGCGTTDAKPDKPVSIVGDTFCTAAKPHTWSRNDTTETIDQTRQHNAGYFARCKGKDGDNRK